MPPPNSSASSGLGFGLSFIFLLLVLKRDAKRTVVEFCLTFDKMQAAMEAQNRDLPEWLRVSLIFTLTFALVCVLGGLAGFEVEWVEPECGYGPCEN